MNAPQPLDTKLVTLIELQCWSSSTHRTRGMQVLKNNGSPNRTGAVNLLLPKTPILYLPYLCPISPSAGNARFIVGSTDMGTKPI